MRCSSSLFFRRGGGFSRLVPSKDAGEAVPLIALVCSGKQRFCSLVLAVSLSSTSFFFFRVLSIVILRHHEEKSAFSPCSRKVGGSSFRGCEREMRLCLSVSLCLSPLRCLCVVSEQKNTFCRFQSSITQESSLGRRSCRDKSSIRLGFMPPERKGNAASTSQSKRSE